MEHTASSLNNCIYLAWICTIRQKTNIVDQTAWTWCQTHASCDHYQQGNRWQHPQDWGCRCGPYGRVGVSNDSNTAAWDIVECKYILIHQVALNDLSLTALVAGITSSLLQATSRLQLIVLVSNYTRKAEAGRQGFARCRSAAMTINQILKLKQALHHHRLTKFSFLGKVNEEGWCGLSPVSGIGSLCSAITYWSKAQSCKAYEKVGWPRLPQMPSFRRPWVCDKYCNCTVALTVLWV